MKNLLKKNNFPKTGHTGYWLLVRGKECSEVDNVHNQLD